MDRGQEIFLDNMEAQPPYFYLKGFYSDLFDLDPVWELLTNDAPSDEDTSPDEDIFW